MTSSPLIDFDKIEAVLVELQSSKGEPRKNWVAHSVTLLSIMAYHAGEKDIRGDISIYSEIQDPGGDIYTRRASYVLSSAETSYIAAHMRQFQKEFQIITEELQQELRNAPEYRAEKKAELGKLEKAAIKPITRPLPATRPIILKR